MKQSSKLLLTCNLIFIYDLRVNSIKPDKIKFKIFRFDACGCSLLTRGLKSLGPMK